MSLCWHKLTAAMILAACLCPQAHSQGTMVRPQPQTDTLDSEGHPKIDSMEATAHGSITLADGSVPGQLVEIYSGCDGARKFTTIADSKGRVSFLLSSLGFTPKSKNCAWDASLDGYRSESRPLTPINPKSDLKLGTIVLQPLVPDAKILSSSGDATANKSQQKGFRNALDEAARQHWSTAIEVLQKVTAANPAFGSAWLNLGFLEETQGDLAGAEKAFLEAVRSDPKFALALIRAAALEARQGNWPAALDHSQKAIDLSPQAFPGAYAVNAMAAINLQKPDAAEKSASAGFKLDPDHHYPELEYSLGLVLYGKGDLEGAAAHLQAYVDRSPNAPNAVGARIQLTQLRASSAAPKTTAPQRLVAGTEEITPAPNNPSIPQQPVDPQIQLRNAPLLAKTPVLTCLETIDRGQVDNRGQLKLTDPARVEIAISDGKEIYAQAGGKRFTSEHLADMIGFSFSTTGLFSSIARALVAGNDVSITPAGEQLLNGASVRRYNFHTVPGARGWSVQFGSSSVQVGEEGWFFVDSTTLILRRVVVQAVDVSRSLKLKSLRAVIDYEPVTLAGARVLLPSVAEVTVTHNSGTGRLSKIFFDHCRVFSSESSLSFEGDGSGNSKHSSPKIELPPDLEIAVSLQSPVSLTAAAENDVITATVLQPVRANGHELIAAGAPVEGHLRLRRGENSVILELDRVQTHSGWAPFYARLISPAPATPARPASLAAMPDPEIPGVAPVYELPAGTRMVWKTETLFPAAAAGTPQLNTTVMQ